MQYSYTNKIVIKNKEFNIEKSRETLSQKINYELKLYSSVIDYTASMITTNDWSEEEIILNLNHLYDNHSIFSLLYYGDATGRFVSSYDWVPPADFEATKRPWYLKALTEEKLVYSEAYVDELSGGLTISISKPVYDLNGQIKGVLAGDILINKITNLVEESKYSVSDVGYSFLIDGRGNILAHPDYNYDDYSNLRNINEVSQNLFNEIKELDYGKKRIAIDGIDGYLSYQAIENTDWVIGSFASMIEYNANNKYLFATLIVALISASLIFMAFLTMQNKYFIRPLKSLVQDIEDINVEKDTSYRMLLDKTDPFLIPRNSINKILQNTEYFFEKQHEYSEELMASYEELEVQNAQLYNLSYYDHLTGLYNRRYYEKKSSELDTIENLPLGIIMADVNGLKLVNDSFGHKIGDQLLQETGKVLSNACNNKQPVFRMGGDEFLILVPQTSVQEMETLVGRIRESTKEVSLNNIKLSISFGMAIKENRFEDIADTSKKAEDEMYSNKLLEGPSMRRKTIDTIVQTLYEKNPREKEHSSRVSFICKEMGVQLGMSDDKIKELEIVGLLHDIGKIAISNSILEKNGSLDNDEWKEIKRHPEIGYRILNTTNEMAQIAKYALNHHERYDGKGYPQGLKGEEVPLVSRIISIADSYDAMVSDRPYRKGLAQEVAIEEIKKNAGTQFDPALAKIFVEEVANNLQ